MRENDVRFTLRIDKELFEKIKASAIINRRAIGREIEFRLDEYFKQKN